MRPAKEVRNVDISPKRFASLYKSAWVSGCGRCSCAKEFRDEMLVDRVKQMVGHMTRQVLEQADWILDQSDVRVHSVPFMKAARFRRAPIASPFARSAAAGIRVNVVITDRREQAPLPTDARWSFNATLSSLLQAAIAFAMCDLRQHVLAHRFQRVRIERMLQRA